MRKAYRESDNSMVFYVYRYFLVTFKGVVSFNFSLIVRVECVAYSSMDVVKELAKKQVIAEYLTIASEGFVKHSKVNAIEFLLTEDDFEIEEWSKVPRDKLDKLIEQFTFVRDTIPLRKP